MNKSYRVIWNYALQCYVVTSELARGKVKSSCSGKAAGKSRLIGGALGSALLLAGSPAALAANGATISDPAQPVELNNQTLQATGDKYYGLLVQNGAKATATDVTVLNAGTSGYGVFSTAGSASAEMMRGSVTTSGAGGYGVVASLTGAVKTSGTKVETSGQTAHGAYASSGGIINSTDTDYITHGDGAYGIYSRAAGSLIDLRGGSVTTDGSKAYGLVAGSGGGLVASDVNITTRGDDSSGVFSNLANTDITLTGGTVTTSGTRASGLAADSGGKLSASDVQVSTSGAQSNGVTASNAGTEVTLTGGTYSTSGESAHGIYAGSTATLDARGVQVVTGGVKSYGAYADNAGTELTLADSTLTTTGRNAYGAYAASGAKLNISGIKLNTSGDYADGGYVSGEGSLLNVNDSTIATSGNGANGLKADGKSTLNASNTVIAITGNGSGTYSSGKGTVLNLSDSKIEMGQSAGNAVLSISDSTTNLKNAEIITDSSNSALAAAFGGTLNSENVSVQARSGGYGIEVQDGSTFNGNNVTIEKSGTDAEGFNAAINVLNLYSPDAHNTLSLSDSAINVSGENATGIVSKRQATLADIKLANTAITATDGTAVNVLTGTSMNIDADNSVLSGSTLLKIGYNTAEGSTAGSVVLNGSNRSLFEGNVDIDRSQTTDSQINLSGSSAWTGASSGLNTLTLSDNSQWNISGDSSVDTLNASNSTLNFTHDGAGFSTLTVNGNYSGDNSTLVMNAALGDDNSATDKLHILGDSSGSTDVVVNNAGGSGAQTIQGLNIIQVDGANNGEFRQKGRIVAGAYDYNLVKGADQHGWYLVSDKNGSEPDPVVTPGEGEGGQIVEPPVDQHNMIVRPEAASYSANLAAANTLFTTSMDDRPAETFYTDANGRQQSTRLWLHNSAGHSRVKDSSGQLKSDTNRYTIQLGGDVAGGTLTGSDSLRLGAMAGYGNAQSKSRSAVSGYQSRGQVNGYSLGVYGSWQQNAAEQSGAFVDSALSYGWFNNSVKGDDIGQQSYKSKGISASLAGGYRAEVATLSDSTSLWLRPQAQLNWQGVKADDVKEQNGSRVQGTGQDNLQSRLGVRASLRTLLDPQSQSAIGPYAEANWLHNSRAFGTALNGVNIQQAGTRNAAEVKLGVDARLNANVNLWGGVAQQLGNHSYSDTSAVAGVKVSF
ncbi:autotransporter outer membrane beta-barrel domain-containing protein [Pantoea dispersa]|uniref:autotransporter outer membrane beta-barrel domain-containing protein n=1 Tax=Pantoea dispersa TaxID=59814 RepID=UPI002DBB22CB|nr:autotransporter outer membrane beta-barrel domain-containing protein [Pantoea dispersa]MEB5836832.1 autotransporter outer membrane beta-barrel domain-containing protein [Pantoea dispersa]